MSYGKLVMCVDDSCSMLSSNKSKNSINYLNQIAQSFSIPTIYLKFGSKVSEVDDYSQSTLQCDDWTEIENCLNDLFKNHLQRFSDAKTKFIFVTDAQDEISNVANVISNKKQCEAAYGNKLHSYCLLVGSGGCANELQQIFGDNAFDHCNDSNFETILQKITGGVKSVQEQEEAEIDISSEIDKLTQDNDAGNRRVGNKMKDIVQKVDKAKAKTEAANAKLQTVKANLPALEEQITTVKNNVDRAHNHDEIDRAEGEVRAAKKMVRTESRRVSDAGKSLDEAADILRGETTRAEDISKKLEESCDRISERASAVIKRIIASLRKLSDITHGSHEQVQELKKKFESDLDDLMIVVNENESLQEQLEQLQESISKQFTSLKRGKTELNLFKQRILDSMDRLNQLLDVLDSRGA